MTCFGLPGRCGIFCPPFQGTEWQCTGLSPAQCMSSPRLQGAPQDTRSLSIQTLRPLRLAHACLWRLLSITREGRGEGARRRRGQDGGTAWDGGGWDADPAPCSCQSATRGSGCSNGSRNMAAAARCFGPEREAEPVKEARVVGSELVDTYTVCRGRERHN